MKKEDFEWLKNWLANILIRREEGEQIWAAIVYATKNVPPPIDEEEG